MSYCDSLCTSTTLSDMIQIVRTRENKHEYSIVSEFADYTGYAEKVFLGQFSHTTTRTKRRILLKSAANRFLCEIPQTPTEIARDYLDIVHPKPLRCTTEQRESYGVERSAPLYYQPTYLQSGVYVDLKSAYLQLLDVIGWNCDYLPNKFISAGRAPYDFPLRDDKIARNSLVTSGLPSTVPVWTGYKLIDSAPRNIHINLGLWSAIQDILHAIARRAYSFGAVYINTDGYILPDEHGYAFQEYLSKEWRLKTEIKYFGEAVVTGVGRYKVGDHKTKHFGTDYQPPFSNVNFWQTDEMLTKTFRAIATDRIDRPYLSMR